MNMQCTVLIFLGGSFEDMGIFHVFIYLSFMGRYNPHNPHNRLGVGGISIITKVNRVRLYVENA